MATEEVTPRKNSEEDSRPRRTNQRINLFKRMMEVLKENDFRILKWMVFFMLTHEGVARLFFDRWYRDPTGFAQKKRILIENGVLNEDLAEIDLLAQNGDKPAELFVAMLHGLINTVLSWDVSEIEYSSILRSVSDPTYSNSDRSKLLMDIHIAFWAFSLYLILIKQTGTKASLMTLHHGMALVYPWLMRSEDFAGHLWCSVSFFSETPTIAGSFAGLLRIYHELFLNESGTDKSLVLAASDLFFLVFVLSFSFIRTYHFTLMALPSQKGLLSLRISADDRRRHGDEDHSGRIVHPLTKLYNMAVFLPGLGMGYYWSYRGLRRLVLELSAKLQ